MCRSIGVANGRHGRALPRARRITFWVRPDAVLLQMPFISYEDGNGLEWVVGFAQAELTFADITSDGVTTIEPIDLPSASLPGQFEIAGVGAYEITTSAGFKGAGDALLQRLVGD